MGLIALYAYLGVAGSIVVLLLFIGTMSAIEDGKLRAVWFCFRYHPKYKKRLDIAALTIIAGGLPFIWLQHPLWAVFGIPCVITFILLFSDAHIHLEVYDGQCTREAVTLCPEKKLKAAWMFRLKNAEARKVLVDRLGIKRICKELKVEVVDAQDNYELLLFELDDDRKRPYLKMMNPSIGVYHIEGVHPFCKTVKEALDWRNQTTERPQRLT